MSPRIATDSDLAIALAQLDRTSGLYGRVEAKASFGIAINLGLLSILVVNAKALLNSSANALLLVFSLSAVFLLLSLYFGYRVHFPHLQGAPSISLLYFGDVSKKSCSQFRSDWNTCSLEQRIDDALDQVWRNSEILSKKFSSVKTMFTLIGAGLPFWFLSLLLMIMSTGTVEVKA